MLGFDALIAYEESGAMKITSNVYAEQRAKTGINTAFEILDKLSAKFNIPYVIDETIEGKGKFMNGKVYINPKEMTDDTAYHEFAHPFIAAIKRLNRPLYNRLIAEIKSEGGILDKTKKLYTQFFKNRGLRGAALQAAIVEEAIVQAIGEYAADAKKVFDKSPTLFGAIKEFLSYIKQTIMDMFNKGTVNVENIPTDTSLKELAIILASDLKITNETRLSREVVEILNQIDRCL
jgi:phage I-like protein